MIENFALEMGAKLVEWSLAELKVEGSQECLKLLISIRPRKITNLRQLISESLRFLSQGPVDEVSSEIAVRSNDSLEFRIPPAI